MSSWTGRGENDPNASCIGAVNQVVQGPQVLVVYQVALGVGQFAVPEVKSEPVEVKAREVTHIGVGGPFARRPDMARARYMYANGAT